MNWTFLSCVADRIEKRAELMGQPNICCSVHGIGKLSVVDASSFADTLSANPNMAVIALAERAADLIREDHQM